MNTQGHPHAKLAIEYWTAAAKNAEEWKNWQYQRHDGEWTDCGYTLLFFEENNYRRKPRTININGYEVPEPLRELPEGGKVWVAEYDYDGIAGKRYCFDAMPYFLNACLAAGLCHDTQEAAQLHLEALTSFTRQK